MATSKSKAKSKQTSKVIAGTWFSVVQAKAAGSLDVSIYDEIGFWGVNASDFKRELDAYSDVSEINLSLHSPGGAVFEGLAIYNMLRNHPATVNVHIDGLAASIASVIAMAGDTITIPENAFMMVHKPWVMASGDAEQLRENADLLDKVETTLIAAYRDKTGLTDEEISDLVSAETWLTGSEAVELGFADQLAEPIKAAASFQSTLTERFLKMTDKVKKKIGEQTPDPVNVAPAAPAPAEPTPAPVAAAPVAAAPSVAEFRAAETKRRNEVEAVFAGFEKFGDLKASALNDMDVTPAIAREQLLNAIGSEKTPSAAQINVGNGAVVRDAIANAVNARVGNEDLESGNAFRAYSLLDMARASLTESGVSVAGLDRMQLVAAAFTHSSGDFGSALQDAAHKSLLKGYNEAEETFQQWTSKGSLSDFREASRVDLSNFPSLRKVAEGAEYKYVTTSDRAEKIMLATYGELFSITRQAIINDDLSVFDRIPRLMGRAAIRTIGDMVYAVLTGNPAMSDGTALFHADHNNLQVGAFGVASLDAAKTVMRTQKEGNGSLNIRPSFLLAPVAREAAAKAYLGAEYDPAYTDKNVPNPVRGMVEVITDARLDDNSNTTEYMVAAPGAYDTIEVAYLDGNETPFLEEQGGFSVDGSTFKVRMDAGVAPLSYRTMVKMSDA